MTTTKTKRATNRAAKTETSRRLDLQDEIGRAVNGARGLRLAVLGLEDRQNLNALDQMVNDHIDRLVAIQQEHEHLRQAAP